MKTMMKALACCALSLVCLFMAIGYAAVTDSLNISGVANVEAYACFSVTYMIGDKLHMVDYHLDPAKEYVVKGAPEGYTNFKSWVNANGHAVSSIPGSNTNDYVLYATWLNKYTINFINASGNLIHSEDFTEGATKISGEGQAIVDKWLADENAKENPNHISVTWSQYNLSSAKADLIVRPQYDYNGYLNLVPVYEEPDDGVVDYYKVAAVNNLPEQVIVPGSVGGIPIKEIDRLTNVNGVWNEFGSNVTGIIIQEGVTQLNHNSLAWTPKLQAVNLPKTLYYMDKNVFSRNLFNPFGEDDKKVLTINFNGTRSEWATIVGRSHSEWANGLEEGTVVVCTDGYFRLEKNWLSLNWKEYAS